MRYNEDTKQIETTTEEIAYIIKGASLIEDLLRISLDQPQVLKIEGITTPYEEVELSPKVVAGITTIVGWNKKNGVCNTTNTN